MKRQQELNDCHNLSLCSFLSLIVVKYKNHRLYIHPATTIAKKVKVPSLTTLYTNEECQCRGNWVQTTCPESLRNHALAGNRTCDLLIASLTPYHCTTTPPQLQIVDISLTAAAIPVVVVFLLFLPKLKNAYAR